MAGTVTYPDARARWPHDARGLSMRSVFTYAGSNSYTTGGEAITAQQVKLGTLEVVLPAVGVNVARTLAVLYVYDPVAGKMQAFWQTGAAAAAALPEVDATTDLSGFSAQVVAEGRG